MQISVIDGFLVAIFLFFLGSVLGWCLEVLFRRFFSAKKWINPGFLTGPYLPIYGFGVAGLFAISRLPIHTGAAWADALIIIAIMGVVMTLIEYIAGLIFIRGMKIKLWDYSNQWGNIQGIICPLFSFFWLIVSALFYFVIDEPVLQAVIWFVHHIEFAFVVGTLFGIFLVDFGHSMHLATKIRKFADEHGVIVHYEKLKVSVRERLEAAKEKVSFAFPLQAISRFKEELTERYEAFSVMRKNKKTAAPAEEVATAADETATEETAATAEETVIITEEIAATAADKKDKKE